MTMKTVKRRDAVNERCSKCKCGKLIDTKDSVYGLKTYHYRCYANSQRGRKVEGDLMYSCPIGKKLDLDES